MKKVPESEKGSVRVERSKQVVPTNKKMRDEISERKLVQLENDNFRSCLATSQIGK
jgi:predicted component of type VI protein secretion system